MSPLPAPGASGSVGERETRDVNALPPPNSTQGGRAKAGMIVRLCDLMEQLEAPQDVINPPLKAVGDKP